MAIKGFLLSLCSSFAPAVFSLLLMPYYLRILGQEGLGLMAVLSVALMVFGVFSAGAGRILHAEIAKSSVLCARRLRTLVRRGWSFYGLIAAVGAVILLPASYFITGGLKSKALHLPPEQIGRCVLWMVVMALLSLVFGYAGVILTALGRLAEASVITLWMAVGNAAGTVLMLQWWPRVDVFYGVQGVVLALGTFAAVRVAEKSVAQTIMTLGPPGADQANGEVRHLVRNSCYLVAAEGLNVAISQMDRILVARLLPLSATGSYSLGSTLNRLMLMSGSPLNLTVTPSICKLAAGEGNKEVSEYLLRTTWLALVLVCAVGIPLIAAGAPLMHVWLRNPEINLEEIAWVLRFLVTGSALQLLGSGFYSFTVARGRLRLGLWLNLTMLLLLPLPGMWAVQLWGTKGAALCWICYGLSYLLVSFYGAVRCGLQWRGQALWLGRSAGVVALSIILGWLTAVVPLGDYGRILVAGLGSITVLALSLLMIFGPRPAGWLHALDINKPSDNHLNP